MRDISPFKHHRFRRELVQVGRVNLHASVTSERIRALLVRKKQNQVRLSVYGHEIRVRTKSAVVIPYKGTFVIPSKVLKCDMSPRSKSRRILRRFGVSSSA